MTRLTLAAVPIAWLAGLAGSPRQDQTVRVTSYGVRLVVHVTQDGRPVRGLGAQDFQVFDAGVSQTIDTAGTSGHVAVVLVQDLSLSVRVPGFDAVIQAGEALVGQLRPGDRAALVAFSDRVIPVVAPTEDFDLVRAGLRRATTSGAGAIPRSVAWDAVLAGAAWAIPETHTPLVVLLSDGMDNASWLTRKAVARALARSGVAVDFVKAPWDNGSVDWDLPGRQSPENLIDETGGEVYSPDDAELARKFAARVDGLRAAYLLTYTPSGVEAGDGWHELTVRVPGRRVAIRTRPGYDSVSPAPVSRSRSPSPAPRHRSP